METWKKTDILFGKAPGKSGIGKSLTRWSDTIRALMGSLVGAAKEAQDPVRWHKFIGAVGSFATDLMMIFGPPVLSFLFTPLVQSQIFVKTTMRINLFHKIKVIIKYYLHIVSLFKQ